MLGMLRPFSETLKKYKEVRKFSRRILFIFFLIQEVSYLSVSKDPIAGFARS